MIRIFIVYHEYAPQSLTITKEYYRDVLRRLRDYVWLKRPELWSTGNCRLHYDNAPAHSSHLIQSFLAKNQIPVVHQSLYSPDMAPYDFWMFLKLKRPKVECFSNNEKSDESTKHYLTQMLLATK